jgi:ketosteroid isomerase-like protein
MVTTAHVPRRKDPDSESSTERQVRALLAEWSDAHRLRDAGRIVAQLTADNVQFILAPPLQYRGGGQPAWDKPALEAWFNTFEGPVGFEVRDLHVTASGDVAFGHFLNCISATAIGQGPFALWCRATFGFRKLDGRWRVAHVHTSVPFEMDGSFRAAIDLTP